MGQKGDNTAAIKAPEGKEQTAGDKPGESFSWPTVIGSPSEKGLSTTQQQGHQMTPSDVQSFGHGDVSPDGTMQFQLPPQFDYPLVNEGCNLVDGPKAFQAMMDQDNKLLGELLKPVGSKVTSTPQEQKDADEIEKLARQNSEGTTQNVIDGNERMRDIFRELPTDAAQNVMDTANRALQKDGYRFVQSDSGQIALVTPGPAGPEVGVFIKNPDCNLS